MKNKGKHILYIAVSLDGYIATKEDSLDWLFEVEGDGDNGYNDFIKNIDCVVMGRRTYDWIIRENKNDFPYKNQKCFVFTNKNDKIEFAQIIKEDVKTFARKMKEEYNNIWIVGGGEIIKEYLDIDEIDEYRITIAPIILGSGIRLFQEIKNRIKLSLIDIKKRKEFVEIVYRREES